MLRWPADCTKSGSIRVAMAHRPNSVAFLANASSMLTSTIKAPTTAPPSIASASVSPRKRRCSSSSCSPPFPSSKMACFLLPSKSNAQLATTKPLLYASCGFPPALEPPSLSMSPKEPPMPSTRSMLAMTLPLANGLSSSSPRQIHPRARSSSPPSSPHLPSPSHS